MLPDCGAVEDAITVDEALRRIRERARPVAGSETVMLAEACGRILAEDVISTINLPPHDSAAMDGYAVFAADLMPDRDTRLPVIGRAAAGHPFARAALPGEAVRVFTGAPMPRGPDTVAIQEHCIQDGRFVRVRPGTKTGANVRHAGEDVMAGSLAIASGQRLGPQHLALAAAIGRTNLPLRRRLKVAVLSSGDELRQPGETVGPGEIYDANRFAVTGALKDLGCEVTDLGILADDQNAVRHGLSAAAERSDLIVTSGGMSDGEEDHVKTAVRALGALSFWSLAIKPGRPVGMGRIHDVPFVGLPGNPVAALVSFLLLVRPFALALMGASETEPPPWRMRAGFCHAKRVGRREYLCVRIERDGPEGPVAHKLPRQGSHLLSTLSAADGLAALEEGRAAVAAGEIIEVLPFHHGGFRP
ncbi:MAG TPA: gephyrin-like molybdotransferase Glp [Stellaceae bacterium]|nr:gephyrin-like molybdotransferase Glp [Stellaceae bacterium]